MKNDGAYRLRFQLWCAEEDQGKYFVIDYPSCLVWWRREIGEKAFLHGRGSLLGAAYEMSLFKNGPPDCLPQE